MDNYLINPDGQVTITPCEFYKEEKKIMNNTKLGIIVNENGAYFDKSALNILGNIAGAARAYAELALQSEYDPDETSYKELIQTRDAAEELFNQINAQ